MPNNQTIRPLERGLSDPVHMTLRFDEELRQRLADAANRAVRSMNGEIIFRLRSSFDREEAAA
jgi:predicted HicB family RNase H-like nuclease